MEEQNSYQEDSFQDRQPRSRSRETSRRTESPLNVAGLLNLEEGEVSVTVSSPLPVDPVIHANHLSEYVSPRSLSGVVVEGFKSQSVFKQNIKDPEGL